MSESDAEKKIAEYESRITGLQKGVDFGKGMLADLDADIKEAEKKLKMETERVIPDRSFVNFYTMRLNDLKMRKPPLELLVRDAESKIKIIGGLISVMKNEEYKYRDASRRGERKVMKVILEYEDGSKEEIEAENSYHAHNIAWVFTAMAFKEKDGKTYWVRRASVPEIGAEFWRVDDIHVGFKATDIDWMAWYEEKKRKSEKK